MSCVSAGYFRYGETIFQYQRHKEAKAARNPMTYLTFGQGPRTCVRSRFAL